MRMRRPTGRITVNTVTIQPTVFNVDADGGRVLTSVNKPSAEISCRAHPSSSRDVPDHLREEGVEYLTLHFFGSTPPAIKIRYLVNWLDFTPPKVLSVIAPPRTAAGEFATWLVDCEYRVPPVAGQS